MKNNFQTIILAVFLAFFVFAVLVFSGLLPIGNDTNSTTKLKGTISMWGTVPSIEFSKAIEGINASNPDLTVKYLQKNQATYVQDIVEAIASGTAPDLFMLPDDLIVESQKFVTQIPYTSFSEKAFRDTFIDGAEVYLGDKGIIALPFSVDPLVLYYNQNLLTNNSIAQPPVYWDDLLELNDTLTIGSSDGTIDQSMVALGTYDNIRHAKDILALLMLQSGNPIVIRQDEKLVSVLSEKFQQSRPPAESVMSFYTEFANPNSTVYSWNRGLPDSRNAFTSGTLAFYIGKGSELFDIQSVNPNLSFDVSTVLQTKGTNIRRTSASMNAIAISKSAKDPALAMSTAMLFANPEVAEIIATTLSLPPARRDMLAKRPTDRYLTVFYDSAISGRTWLDPDTTQTNKIFSDMVGNILSNKFDVGGAVSRAEQELGILLY